MKRYGKVAAADIRQGYTAAKRAIDRQHHYFGYLVARPLSFPIAAQAIRLGLTASQVTIAGLLILIVGLALIFAGSFASVIAGAALLNLWYLLDFVDGSIARYTGATSRFGAFLDWWVGHIFHIATPCAASVALVNSQASPLATPPQFIIFLGLAWSVLEASRTAISSQSRHAAKGGDLNSMNSLPPGRITPGFLVSAVVSFKSPMLLVAAITNQLGVWLITYATLSVFMWGAVSLRSLRSAIKSDRLNPSP